MSEQTYYTTPASYATMLGCYTTIRTEELDKLRKERDDALKKVMEMQEAEIKRLKEVNERIGNATDGMMEGFGDIIKGLNLKVKSPQQEMLPVPVPPAVSSGVFG